MKLVIVESPSKIKKITSYLGDGYLVKASFGHIIDLPKKELGINTSNYHPNYVVGEGKRKVIKELKEAYNKCDELILAVDLDREGEAIGWHVAREVGAISKSFDQIEYIGKPVSRIVFTEITKSAIQKSLQNKKKIDFNMVNAQQVRRVLDRLVGYTLSPFLWKKVKPGLSAGRVQSVAVRLIVDREQEIIDFKPSEYWKIHLNPLPHHAECQIKFIDKDAKEKTESMPIFSLIDQEIKTKQEAEEIINSIKDSNFVVDHIESTEELKKPKAPFTTSTMQQVAIQKLKIKSSEVMKTAQSLYEAGLITYMRTDAKNLASEAVDAIREHVKNKYGDDYVPSEPNSFKTASSAQEAHEAIRPTDFSKTPETIELEGKQKDLYSLIFNRAVMCQMSSAKFAKQTITINVNDKKFQATGKQLLFDGFLKLAGQNPDDSSLPKLEQGMQVYPEKLIAKQAFTKPPARYSEPLLIKKLEREGVGRPSTYSSIISTIENRGYVLRDEKDNFYPDKIAFIVIDMLKNHFSNIVDIKFTANLEKQLDDVAGGKASFYNVIDEFYKPFINNLKQKEQEMKDEYSQEEKAEFKCPLCNSDMTIRDGKYGKFASCSKYPECKGTINLEKKDGKPLPDINSEEFKNKYEPAPIAPDNSTMVLRSGKYGYFWSHADMTKKETKPLLVKEKCPQCQNNLTERSANNGIFLACSNYPECKYTKEKK